MHAAVEPVELPRLAAADKALSSSGRYCVSTPTVSIPEFVQFESGKSMIRNFPPNGTAGFAMSPVSTYRRLPCPPASSMATHSFFIAAPS